MREIKFKVWIEKFKEMNDVTKLDLEEGIFYCDRWQEGIKLHPFCKLLEFTGLKDKNGREIYEGDIISSGVVREVVVMLEGYWSCATFKTDSCVEIVGNIYKNPELLKGDAT